MPCEQLVAATSACKVDEGGLAATASDPVTEDTRADGVVFTNGNHDRGSSIYDRPLNKLSGWDGGL